jgi:hypothetical protein
MTTITEEEYKANLIQYIKDQFFALSEEEKPKGLRANFEFNLKKTVEFNQKMLAEGVSIE